MANAEQYYDEARSMVRMFDHRLEYGLISKAQYDNAVRRAWSGAMELTSWLGRIQRGDSVISMFGFGGAVKPIRFDPEDMVS